MSGVEKTLDSRQKHAGMTRTEWPLRWHRGISEWQPKHAVLRGQTLFGALLFSVVFWVLLVNPVHADVTAPETPQAAPAASGLPASQRELWARLLTLVAENHGYTPKARVEAVLGIRFTDTVEPVVPGAARHYTVETETEALGHFRIGLSEGDGLEFTSLTVRWSDNRDCLSIEDATKDLNSLGWVNGSFNEGTKRQRTFWLPEEVDYAYAHGLGMYGNAKLRSRSWSELYLIPIYSKGDCLNNPRKAGCFFPESDCLNKFHADAWRTLLHQRPPKPEAPKTTLAPTANGFPASPQELWARLLTLIAEDQGYMPKERIEAVLGIRFNRIDSRILGREPRYEVIIDTEELGRLRVFFNGSSGFTLLTMNWGGDSLGLTDEQLAEFTDDLVQAHKLSRLRKQRDEDYYCLSLKDATEDLHRLGWVSGILRSNFQQSESFDFWLPEEAAYARTHGIDPMGHDEVDIRRSQSQSWASLDLMPKDYQGDCLNRFSASVRRTLLHQHPF